MPATEPVVETVRIEATPEEVFPYFTEPAALTRWLGDPAELEARPGGAFVVQIRGETVRGQYVEVDPPRRVRITWGRDGSTVLAPGASEVDVRLEAVDGGTLVTLVHRGLPPAETARHGEGWRHFLARLVPSVLEAGRS